MLYDVVQAIDWGLLMVEIEASTMMNTMDLYTKSWVLKKEKRCANIMIHVHAFIQCDRLVLHILCLGLTENKHGC